MTGRRALVAMLAALATAVVVGPAPAAPAAPPATGTPADEEFTAATPPQTPGLPDLDRLDPVRYPYEDAVVEHAQVASRDGLTQIWVDVIRPDVPEGMRVPTIMMASPYFNTLGRGYQGQCKTPHQSPPGGLPGSPGCGSNQAPFPEWYDEYFVPRGYAFAAMDLRGTRNSSGCQTYGDRDEVFDAVDVVDWIADQPWSNGKVGMTGGSYDGTIATGAAAEQPLTGRHPDALAAVIPIRAIDRWYDYHFFNGVQSLAHAATPALFTAQLAGEDLQNSGTDDVLYPVHVAERKACIATLGAAVDVGYSSPYQDATSPFWAERDFVKDAAGMRAAVFAIHGLFDFNVKTNNVGHLWEALPAALPKKLWLFNGDHADPRCHSEEACAPDHAVPFALADRFIEANHRWWLQFLKGVEAGALTGPAVEVQRYDGTWDGSARYPAATGDLVLYPTVDGTMDPLRPGDGSVTWSDGVGLRAPAEQTFVTAPFPDDVRLSGQIQFDLSYAGSGPDTTIAVQVDDLAPDVEDDAPADDTLYDRDSLGGALSVTFGWLRAWYRDSVKPRGLSAPSGGGPLVPDQREASSFPALYTDYVVRAGHRLRFTFSNAAGGTVPSLASEVVTMYVGGDGTSIRLPVAPLAAAPPAGGPRPGPRPVPPQAPRPPVLPVTGGLPAAGAALVLAATAVAARRRLRAG